MGETATLSWHPIAAIHLSDVVFLWSLVRRRGHL